MQEKLLRDFLTIWVTIEPVGSLVLFAVLTGPMAKAEQRRTAFRAVAYSAVILIGAIVVGQLLLAALDISIKSFQVAGGIILFLFGLQMVFGRASDHATRAHAEEGHDVAIFPLAIPSIVGPEAILAVILLTDNHVYPVQMQVMTAGVVIVVLAITYLLLISAQATSRVLGRAGASILERVTGMILAALAVEYALNALGLV